MDRGGSKEISGDPELVARVRAGDRAAFGPLVERYQRMIYHLALRMTGSQAEAWDVVQNSFLQAYRQLGGFRGEASFKTWLYGIALNECRMLHRRARRTVAIDSIAEPAAEASGGDPLDRRVLNKWVVRLPEKQRAALLLRVCEDLSFREIGEMIGTSEASAKVSYFHAVKKLRGWMTTGSAELPDAESDE
jgi:RNA polymerase sigma-70 factor, ECF subfamily